MVGLLAAIGRWVVPVGQHFCDALGGAGGCPCDLLFILTYVFRGGTRDLLAAALGLLRPLGRGCGSFPMRRRYPGASGLVFSGAGANGAMPVSPCYLCFTGWRCEGVRLATARGLYLGGILSVSLGFRMVDDAVCASVTAGTISCGSAERRDAGLDDRGVSPPPRHGAGGLWRQTLAVAPRRA